MLSRFHRVSELNGQTGGQTDRIAIIINVARQCADARDKNCSLVVLAFSPGCYSYVSLRFGRS